MIRFHCVWFYLIAIIPLILSQCYNSCSRNGLCNEYSRCDCFTGYEGADCSKRSCPKGIMYTDLATSTNVAHNNNSAGCSGHGECDYKTGLCKCDAGYSGLTCSKKPCPKNCNNHGKCISLRQAAETFDGWSLNHTTSYSNWDADLLYGCQCDPGWSGHDCSEKICESGPDPRTTSSFQETVTLVCTTTSNTFSGKFKLRFQGRLMKNFLNTTSTVADLARELMKINNEYANLYPSYYTPITVTSTNINGLLCAGTATVTTSIKYHKNRGDVAALSFYYQKLTGASLFFQTTQYLQCDCVNSLCGGSFQLVYDGEVSPRINIFDPGSVVYSALSEMKTLAGQVILFQNETRDSEVGTTNSGVSICSLGAIRNHTIVLQGPIGNLPSFTLITSGVRDLSLPYYTAPDNTSDTSRRILQLYTFDGRNQGVKMCNGIGHCDYEIGSCKCAYGWELSPQTGQCSQPVYNTSDWAGITRCPGVVSRISREDWTAIRNEEKIYVSINPVSGHWSAANLKSMIYMYDWSENATAREMRHWENIFIRYPRLVRKSRQTLLNMTTTTSAGPLVLDRVTNTLIYVDNNVATPFIGKIILSTNSTLSSSSVWYNLPGQIFGLTLDAHYSRRKLYWSIPDTGPSYGSIYWAYVDSVAPTPTILSATVGSPSFIHPMGLAIHYPQSKLYWVDTDLSLGYETTVLRTYDLDGSAIAQAYLYNIAGVPIEANATDIVINLKNNTLYFISNVEPKEIVITNLNELDFLNLVTNSDRRDYYNYTYVRKTQWMNFSTPRYLFTDDTRDVLIWTDPGLRKIHWVDMKRNNLQNVSSGTIWDYHERDHPEVYEFSSFQWTEQEDTPIGIVIDKGMQYPEWGQYLDCYGNGRCKGLAGNWECECYDGFYGDCTMRTCPTGVAWFSEPYVDDISHDIEVECSNAGKCNRQTGECECDPGYEGSACQRSTCPASSTGIPCSGNGRCLSMKSLALKQVNSSGDSTPVIYGSQAHSSVTWDADMQYACYPEEYGYVYSTPSAPSSSTLVSYHAIPSYSPTSLDLSSQLCPFGYDIKATDQPPYTEIQRIQCRATSGSFYLSFHNFQSSLISFDTTLVDLEVILQTSLGSVGDVRVTNSTDELTVCSTDSSVAMTDIEFLTELSGRPLLVMTEYEELAVTSGSVTFTITEVRKGSGRYLECSGKGTCDRRNGVCECWPGWGSSDGRGNEGTRGDCGYNLIF